MSGNRGNLAVDPRGGAVDPAGLVERVHDRALALDPSVWAELPAPARRARVAGMVRADAPLLADQEVEATIDRVLARLGGLGPLEPLLDDPTVTEVMVNGGGRVWVERAGRLHDAGLQLDEPLVLHLIERIVAPLGLRIDRSSPIVDARLADGSRINAIIRPIAVDGACLTIRRFGVRPVALEAFAGGDVLDLLRWAVAARCNVLISGGTGSGKTTLLNALASAIPPGERLITIEDTAELQLPGDHVVRLEARPANAEGAGRLSVRELVRNALRMRPDRIIVGEVRGDEALDMLQAMNTGHEGSMSTCHANSAPDALRRIETMILMGADDVPLAAVREQIVSSLDLVVHVERQAGGGRGIAAVHEVVDRRASRSTDEGDGPTPIGETSVLVERGALVNLPSRPARARLTVCCSSTGSRP
jgi:pilus assembly protein CpaF